jgi:hypothetical protein
LFGEIAQPKRRHESCILDAPVDRVRAQAIVGIAKSRREDDERFEVDGLPVVLSARPVYAQLSP